MGQTMPQWIAVQVGSASPTVVAVRSHGAPAWRVDGDALLRTLPAGSLVARLLMRVIDRTEAGWQQSVDDVYPDVHPSVKVRVLAGAAADQPTASSSSPSSPPPARFTARCTLEARGGNSVGVLQVGDYVD